MVIVVTPNGIEVDGILLSNTAELRTFIGAHAPHDLSITFGIWNYKDLDTNIYAVPPKDFNVIFHIYQRRTIDLFIRLTATHTGNYDLNVLMHVWSLKDFVAHLGGHPPSDFYALLKAWHTKDIDIIVDTIYPSNLNVDLVAEPDPGTDLIVVHRIHRRLPLLVSFDIWLGLLPLNVYLHGLYPSDLSVDLTMGSKLDLTTVIPMQTGYSNLAVTLKPASRIMSTIITVHTMELKDLYVSINQGWPCGFGSSYKILNVTLNPSFFHNLVATFKVITGSGTSQLGVYLNKPYFDSVITSQELSIYVPPGQTIDEGVTEDALPLVYENAFTNVIQDIFQVKLSWPRFRRLYGNADFNVTITAFVPLPVLDLQVYFTVVRPDAPRMPQSSPILLREGLSDPVWPDVFQVKEIELWADDLSEVVRRVEIMFGEQIREYYWVSKDQRAYSKNLWEKWTLLARGYLPDAIYSGQIDYVTMRELSDMKKYDSIDAAIRALIANFLYHGKTDLSVVCNPTGTYSSLSVVLDIRGRDRISNLRVTLEPMHTSSLEVVLQCV